MSYCHICLFHVLVYLLLHLLRDARVHPTAVCTTAGQRAATARGSAGPGWGARKAVVGGRTRRSAGRVGTWAAGCSCRLGLPPLVSKIVRHLHAGLDVARPPGRSGHWPWLALLQSRAAGVAARSASPQTLSPPPRGDDVITSALPPR